MQLNLQNSAIKTVLFDVDGVLVQGALASRYFEEKYGIDHHVSIEFYRGPFAQCLTGERDMYEVLPAYLKKWGWKKTPQAFAQEWFDFENRVDAQLMAFVQQLRQDGLHCYVTTNQERHRAQYMLDHMGFAKGFDGLFASAHLGHVKPDLAFFERVCRKLAITDKTSVLFWDDSQANVDAAIQFGICGEVYTTFDAFQKTMHERYNMRGAGQ